MLQSVTTKQNDVLPRGIKFWFHLSVTLTRMKHDPACHKNQIVSPVALLSSFRQVHEAISVKYAIFPTRVYLMPPLRVPVGIWQRRRNSNVQWCTYQMVKTLSTGAFV